MYSLIYFFYNYFSYFIVISNVWKPPFNTQMRNGMPTFESSLLNQIYESNLMTTDVNNSQIRIAMPSGHQNPRIVWFNQVLTANWYPCWLFDWWWVKFSPCATEVRIGPKMGQKNGPNGKSFSDQFQYILAHRQNVLKLIWKRWAKMN